MTGKKMTGTAQLAGLRASIPSLLVVGDNRPGLGYTLTHAIAEAGINIAFLVTQIMGRKYTSVFGFESDEAASKAASIIKKAVASRAKVSKKSTKK